MGDPIFQRSLQDLIKGIRANKRDVATYISQSIADIKNELKSTDPFLKSEAVRKLTYLQMIGYNVSWASFGIVEVMSQPRFAHKRIGYLAANGMKPEISLKVNDAEFFTESLTIDSVLKGLQRFRDKYDLNKINLNGEVQIKNIEQGDDAFKNVTVNAKNDGVLWNIKSLAASYHDSSFQSSGSLRMDPMTINLSYAYNNFNITQLRQVFPLSVFGLEEGWGSSNGMISTSGDNMSQLLYNLYTKSNFVTKNLKWNNFGIDDLITAINNPEYDVASLQKDTNYYIGNGTTVMNGLSGDLELDHGMFKFTNIAFDTSRVSGSAGVNYSIYNANISLASKLLFSQPATIYNTKPKPVAISFNLSDNVLSPKKEIDFQEVASFLGKRKANKR